MKKTIALCLAGAMTIATCGLAACGESGGDPTVPEDPETSVSDKIETDEQWDKAMWDTFTYLFDFEGEDDPTKTYEKFPYWHPNSRSGSGSDVYNYDLKLAQDRNFKVDAFYDIELTEVGKQVQNYSIAYDMGKYHAFGEDIAKSYGGNSSQDFVTKWEEYKKYSEAGKLMYVGKITEDKGPAAGEDPLNVWSNQLHVDGIAYISIIETFFNYSHFELLKEQGEAYLEEHPSVLEFAKYDEEKGGYVITDTELMAKINNTVGFGSSNGMTYTFKFENGMLVAAWYEWPSETTLTKVGFTITYGGQNVTFPDNLPW